MLTCAINKQTFRVIFSGGEIFDYPGHFVPPLVSVSNIALFMHHTHAFDKFLLSRINARAYIQQEYPLASPLI